MASKIKQDILRFPVCKTRSSSRSSKIHFQNSSLNTYKTNCFSPVKGTSDCINNSRNSTPRKTKLEYNSDQENAVSPSKRKCAASLSDQNIINLNGVLPIVSLERTPLKNVNSTPRKVTETLTTNTKVACKDLSSPPKLCQRLNFDAEVRRSPRKKDFKNPTPLISQLSLFSPKAPRTTIGLHKAELKPYHLLKSSFAQNISNQIVGRETEINFLKEFFKKHLAKGIAGSLYISGAPGTGKTVSVTKIIDNLSNIRFKKIFLNCMSKKSSKEIFTSIAEGLNFNSSRVRKDLVQQIEKTLRSSKVPILIILDEVDQLESKDQEVLYTLFEWPSLAKSKLVLVGIANMLDLTDRILPRLQSSHSCQPHLLHFSPYSKMEIVEIINKRIKAAEIGDVTVIKPSAVHFLAAKVSSMAGDARIALDVCRRAVELCEIQASNQFRLSITQSSATPKKFSGAVLKQVDITQILSIFNEVYGSRVMTEIKENPSTFPLQQKVLICTLLLILKHSKTKNVNLGKFHDVYFRVCLRQKLPGVEQSEFFSLCTLLESRGILQVKKTKELRNSKIFLHLNEEEAEMALGDRDLLVTILEDKNSLNKSNQTKVKLS